MGFDSDIGFDDQIRDFMGFKQEQYGFDSQKIAIDPPST
jgi:hypothetical protein